MSKAKVRIATAADLIKRFKSRPRKSNVLCQRRESISPREKPKMFENRCAEGGSTALALLVLPAPLRWLGLPLEQASS